MGRFVINLFYTAIIAMILNALGWIHLQPKALVADPLVNMLLSGAILGLAFAIIYHILDYIYEKFIIHSCGLGCIILPVVMLALGYIVLLIIAHYAPSFLRVTDNLLLGILSGLLLGIKMPKFDSSS